LSQEQLGQKVGYSGAQVGKVETGERTPSQDFAQHCDRALPNAGGLFARIYELARRWDGGYPSWFTEWVEAERRAISIHTLGTAADTRTAADPPTTPARCSRRGDPPAATGSWISWSMRAPSGN
jgi:transcriptional regulator with XRE-family HTH domain